MESKARARAYIRQALLIGLTAPGFEYLRYVIGSRGAGYYEVGVLLGGLALAAGSVIVWFLGLSAIELVSTSAHAMLSRRAPRAQWNGVTFKALWPLPIAAALGVATWFIYSLGEFSAWPGDMIFGVVANVIGAWCYCTVLLSWIRLRRDSTDDSTSQC